MGTLAKSAMEGAPCADQDPLSTPCDRGFAPFRAPRRAAHRWLRSERSERLETPEPEGGPGRARGAAVRGCGGFEAAPLRGSAPQPPARAVRSGAAEEGLEDRPGRAGPGLTGLDEHRHCEVRPGADHPRVQLAAAGVVVVLRGA